MRLALLSSLALAVAACNTTSPSADAAADGDASTSDGSLDGASPTDAGPSDSGRPAARPIPFQVGSPWPRFRGNEVQDALGTVRSADGAASATPWVFRTGKGIFSSPVIGADGTVYVGSADRVFYAIDGATGLQKWRFPTGEIIDSAALLDDLGRVYFGSGDGHVYALDAQTGQMIWRFEADDPATTSAFIRWFEGNIAMGPDGTLYAPNDNFRVYAIDRVTGTRRWAFTMPDQTWSSPAIDSPTGALFIGNNNLLPALGNNTFSISADGTRRWQRSSLGTVAASPLLARDFSRVVVGGFDGYVRAYDPQTGRSLWDAPTRDHLYASPARLPNGDLVQPSADGTVYALDPATGAQRWAFDTRDPIRSSPAIDAEGHVYFGGGDGRLYVLDPNGTLRWRIQLVTDERNDLNASPALGRDAVVIAAESGEVFSVPYDFCLRTPSDPRCAGASVGEDLPADGARLAYVTQLGAELATAPTQLDENQPLAFALSLRRAGDTVLGQLDAATVRVTVEPAAEVDVDVSADRHFLTVVPRARFTADASGRVRVRVTGDYLVDPMRTGLAFSGGTRGGSFDSDFTFTLSAERTGPLPLAVPTAPGDPQGTWELYRLAAPLPTILPSYNQIGFDSLHYLIGLVEGDATHAIAFVQGALLDASDRTVVDPSSKTFFPIDVAYRNGALTFENRGGFQLQAYSLNLAFDRFRVSARVDAMGRAERTANLRVTAVCGGIDFYGPFLRQLGFCNADSDLLLVWGAALLRPYETGARAAPTGVGTASFSLATGRVTATLTGSALVATEHALTVLLVDAATGRAVTLPYGERTRVDAMGGVVTAVSVDLSMVTLPASLRAYLMVDGYPAARSTLP